MPQRLNAREYYYTVVAPQENYNSYQSFHQKDIWQEQLQMSRTADKTQNIQNILTFMPNRSNDFKLNEHIEHIAALAGQKLQNYFNDIFIAKRRNYIANAAAVTNEGDYDGDLVYFYVGISNLCEQYCALFAAFLSLRQLKSASGYDKNEARRLSVQISQDVIKLTVAQSDWQRNGNCILLDPGLVLGAMDFEPNEMDRLGLGINLFTDRFILCHEISHHLLGHTGRTDLGSSYLT